MHDGNRELRAEIGEIARIITVGESYFFRSSDQLEQLMRHALPDRIAAAAATRPVRLLSAGCSSGQEPYCLAMLIEEYGIIHPTEIDACDVDPAALDDARAAVYSEWSLRSTSATQRARYFERDGARWRVAPRIASRVRFHQVNLADEGADFWRDGAYDVILCRNVIMYFTPSVAAAVLARFHRALTPGGWLFLGHSETIRGISRDFELVHSGEAFFYRRRGGPATPAPLPSPRGRPRPLDGEAGPDTHTPEAAENVWADVIDASSRRIAELATPAAIPQPAATRSAPRREPAQPPPLAQALALYHQERYDEVADLLAAVASDAVVEVDAAVLRAAALLHAGQRGAAQALCERILRFDDLVAEAHYLLALCHEQAGRLSASAEEAQAAAHLDPTFAMPQLHLGLLAQRRSDVRGARRALGAALERLARDPAERVLLFGGGFDRGALIRLCENQLTRLDGIAS